MEWWNSIPQFWQAAFFVLAMYGVLQGIDYYLKPLWKKRDLDVHEREQILRANLDDVERRLEDSEKKNLDMTRRLEESERKNKEHEAVQKHLLSELDRAKLEIQDQKGKVSELSDKVRVLEKTSPITPVETKPFQGRVLGVWPESAPIDSAGERSAVANTGLEYEALEGEQATRWGIVEQLGQRDYRILEIGAKGGAAGIRLKDGMAPPSWWSRLARQHNIEIFVVLANESSMPGVENVADALFNAGARAVVSVDSTIDDPDAVEFARMFYRRLSRGVPLAKAVDYARLAITDAGADTIKLREKNEESQR